MWDAVRKMFRHDEKSHDATVAGSPSGAAGTPRSQDPRTTPGATMPGATTPGATMPGATTPGATPSTPSVPTPDRLRPNPTVANTVPLSPNESEGYSLGNTMPAPASAPASTANAVGDVSGASGIPTMPLSLSDEPTGSGQDHDNSNSAPASPRPVPTLTGTGTPPSTRASTSDTPIPVGGPLASAGGAPVEDVEQDTTAVATGAAALDGARTAPALASELPIEESSASVPLDPATGVDEPAPLGVVDPAAAGTDTTTPVVDPADGTMTVEPPTDTTTPEVDLAEETPSDARYEPGSGVTDTTDATLVPVVVSLDATPIPVEADLDTTTVVETVEIPPMVVETVEIPAMASAASTGPVELAPGTVVGGRYTIMESAPADDTTGVGSMGSLAYRATDARSYERCWSCGSTANGPRIRFCQNCGAPVQNHPVTLVEASEPTGQADEVAYEGIYLRVKPERRRFGIEGVGVELGAHSAEGPHHPNEDSYWYQAQVLCGNSTRQSLAVAILSDGMGGYTPGSGLISSRIAAVAGTSIVAALAGLTEEADEAAMERIVRAGIAAANAMVLQEIARRGEMGATLVVTVIYGDTAYLANVGDSRAYYVDPLGHTTRITRDQSLVGQEVYAGRMAERDMYTAPGSNIILHAIGEHNAETAADWYTQPLEPGSYLIVCSDGYWKTMRGAVLPVDTSATSSEETLTRLAARMVEEALARNSDDNTTVLLIAIS